MRTPRKLALSVTVFAIAAATLEIGLRAIGFRREPPPPIVIWNVSEDAAIESGASVYRVDRDLLWSPIPGASIQALAGPSEEDEFVNEKGFRGPVLPVERTPGKLRIATLGDSSTFGLGVEFEECYGAQLVAKLAQAGVEAELLNAGVVGFTARQGLERYLRDVRQYRPDVVIAAFGAINDGAADDLNDEDKLVRLRSERGGGVLRWLREHSRTVQLAGSLGGRGRALPRQRSERGPSDPPTSRTMPEGTVPRVSLEAFEAAIEEIGRIAEEDGARVLLVSMPRRRSTESPNERPHLRSYTEKVEELAERHRWPMVDALRLFREHPERKTLLLDPFHPSPIGHELIAEGLARALLDAGATNR